MDSKQKEKKEYVGAMGSDFCFEYYYCSGKDPTWGVRELINSLDSLQYCFPAHLCGIHLFPLLLDDASHLNLKDHPSHLNFNILVLHNLGLFMLLNFSTKFY